MTQDHIAAHHTQTDTHTNTLTNKHKHTANYPEPDQVLIKF